MEDYKKKYEEALERAREELGSGCFDRGTIEYIFPELKESEDEKIKKEIIRIVDGYFPDKASTQREKYIAWLKKQGEQKPTDKVEPKFKVGDWVMLNENYHNSIYQVEKIETYHYVLRHILGGTFCIPFGENPMRLWTIQDAKDGDVLVVNNYVFIYAHRKQMYSIAVAHCFIDNAGDFHFDGEFGYVENGDSTYPATRKQRDTLFAKMKEAGYEWNAEKKQVIKL